MVNKVEGIMKLNLPGVTTAARCLFANWFSAVFLAIFLTIITASAAVPHSGLNEMTPVENWVVAQAMAGEIADGYICTSGKAPELYSETLLPNVAAGLQAAGRAAGSIDRMIEMKVSFDTDRQRALDDTRHWAALALSPEEKVSVEDPREMEKLADALPVERTAKRWIVSTDPDEHVARIKAYADLGFRHLVFHAPGPDQKRFLHLYGEQVLPRLRTAFG